MKQMQTCNILKVNVTVTNMKHTVEMIDSSLEEMRGHYICASNVHTTVMAYEDPTYLKVQNQAIMALPDGKPLSVIERKRGFKEAEKVSGPDLMPAIMALSEKKGYTHFFYGSDEETLERLKENLLERFPKLKIVGMISPPYRELTSHEEEAFIARINEVHPDFLWVGLGAPKQEKWMAAQENKIDSLMIGVGAAFAFHAGMFKRAPLWMQNAGLEWFHRLCQDPVRLWKRYVVTNTKFIWYMLWNK